MTNMFASQNIVCRWVGPKVQLGALFISDLKRMAHIGSLERLDAELAKYKNKRK